MNQFLDRLSGLTNQSLMILFFLVTGFYYIAIFNDGSDLDARLMQITGELQEQEKFVKESEQALFEIEQVRGTLGSMTEQFKLVTSQLPTTFSQTEMLSLVDRLSKEAGVAVKSKEWREQRKETGGLEVLPMKISAEGTYPEILGFLNKLTDSERVVTTGNLAIIAPRNLKQSLRSSLELELKVYRYVGTTAAEVKR